MKFFKLLLCFLMGSTLSTAAHAFNKIVLWGHKLHSHSHSYIHLGFYRAFEHLGYDTRWFDDNDDVSHIDFSNSLFITEGQVDKRIPLRTDCVYVLHHCDVNKYANWYRTGKALTLQVYTHDCLTRNVEKIDDYIYYQPDNRTLYMPWATDLLPDEIDAIKQETASHLKKIKKSTVIHWIGQVGYSGTDPHSNYYQLHAFAKACDENDLPFIYRGCFHPNGGVSSQENIAAIQESYLAPAIVCKWQNEKGYIPCRAFKNISYGQMICTNSKTIHELFMGKIVYNEDTYQLFYDAQNRLNTINIHELHELMDFVRDKHTYINRVEVLLRFAQPAKN